MSRALIILPEVSSDFLEAFDYYENLSPNRGGTRLDGAFRAALQQVKDGSITHTRVFVNFHRVILRRFPYNLYYRLVDEQAVIVGLLYARYDPENIDAIL